MLSILMHAEYTENPMKYKLFTNFKIFALDIAMRRKNIRIIINN